MSQSSFFAELRRRHVYKVGAMYAVAGWLLVQVATQVFPFFGISNSVVKWTVLAIVAGFPVALVLAWLFDLTPQGIVRTSDLSSEGEAPAVMAQRRSMDRKLNYLLGVLLLVGLGYEVLSRFAVPRPAEKTADPAASASLEKSIAVLPFENLSDDKANAYFATGIQDEILTRLSKIGALKVISRTSTAHYASSPDNLPEIAHQLGVANILEGSVQRVGDAVHINVQLIRAANDAHLWAESYDRKLDNVFGVEADVAGAIAAQLDAALTGAERQSLARKLTSNPAAYDAYLRARAVAAEDHSIAAHRKTAELLQEALRLDPGFAEAWAQLSIAESYLNGSGIDPDIYTPEAIKQAADTATRLQPDLTSARLAQGMYRYRVLRDLPGAAADLEAALEHAPNDEAVLKTLGWVQRRQGRFEQALAHLEKAAQIDPHDAELLETIGGETLAMLGRWDEVRVWLDRSLALEPKAPLSLAYKVDSYQAEGRLEDAARLLATIPLDGEAAEVANQRVYQRLLEHDYGAAISEAEAFLKRPLAAQDGYGPALCAFLGFAQLRSGQPQPAEKSFRRLIDMIGPSGAERGDDLVLPSLLAIGYAGTGQLDKALAQARRGVEIFKNDAIHVAQATETLALVQAWAGDRDAAIATLEAAQRLPNRTTLPLLRLDPQWDELRNDPRFRQLVGGSSGGLKT